MMVRVRVRVRNDKKKTYGCTSRQYQPIVPVFLFSFPVDTTFLRVLKLQELVFLSCNLQLNKKCHALSLK